MGQGSSRRVDQRSTQRQARGRSFATRTSANQAPLQVSASDSRLDPSQTSVQSSRNPLADGTSSSLPTLRSGLRRRTARLSRNRLSSFFGHDTLDTPEDGGSSSLAHSNALPRRRLSQQQQSDESPAQARLPQLDSSLETPPVLTTTPTPPTPETPRLRPQRSPHTIADRISSLTPDRGFRHMTASLRRRRSPLRDSEDPSAALTRLLSLAAQATAASLLGRNVENAMADLRSPSGGIEGDDGTFNGFLQALQNGRFAAALNQDERSTGDQGDAEDEPPAAFEFFRMFRFGSSSAAPRRRQMQSPSRPSSSLSTDRDNGQEAGEDATMDEEGEHRMIPILIVGVRALGESDELLSGGEGNVPSFFDALTSGPTTVSLGLPDNPPSDGLRPLNQEPPRNSHRRRASMGGFNLFSHGREATRHPRYAANRPRSDLQNIPALESPPGPFPPPTTPSSPGLSAFSSETSTPTRRSSFSTSGSLNTTSRRNSLIRRVGGTTLEPTAEESPNQPRPSRRRRSSEPDAPHFGSGSSRRNGVLMEPRDSPAEGHRSWIIYILGGSYPENHPILTTPSLFTDSPTYEDMILLSSLLGQAKPPVANAEDIALAGGLFRIQLRDSIPVAVEAGGEEQIPIAVGEQCLVCLSSYQHGEEARRLVKCQHLFHRECIDHWLTTGRNSCPLCRGQGVDEKKSETDNSERSQSSQPSQMNAI